MLIEFNKKAFIGTVEMSFDIPDEEKAIAEKAVLFFEATSAALAIAVEHLDNIYEPFQKHENISTQSIVERRFILNRLKQSSIKKFDDFKKKAFYAIRKLNYFSNGDKDIQELIASFESSVDELEEELNNFYDVLDDYRSKNFRESVIETIDNIKSIYEKLESLISDRIIKHIDTEILAKKWLSETHNQYNIKEDERIPLIVELFNERQNMLHANPKEQVVNSSDTQQMVHPDLYTPMTGE